MAIKKPEKSVSGMDVLKDIRGLLSSNREPQEPVKPEAVKESGISEAEKASLEARISGLQAQIKSQQEELARTKKEKDELTSNQKAVKNAGISDVEKARLESQITELKTQVKSQQDEIGIIKAEKAGFEAQIAEFRTQIKTQQNELAKITKEKDESTSKQKAVKAAGNQEAERSKFEAQVKDLQKQLQEQQHALAKTKNEKEELTGKLKTLSTAKESPAAPVSRPPVKNDDIAMIEARIADLTSTMEQIDGLLKSKSQDLMKRIARVFNEAGQSDVAIEFRKGADGLESAENFARFLETLME